MSAEAGYILRAAPGPCGSSSEQTVTSAQPSPVREPCAGLPAAQPVGQECLTRGAGEGAGLTVGAVGGSLGGGVGPDRAGDASAGRLGGRVRSCWTCDAVDGSCRREGGGSTAGRRLQGQMTALAATQLGLWIALKRQHGGRLGGAGLTPQRSAFRSEGNSG